MSRVHTSRGNTREDILDAAEQLVQSQSYDGFSYRDLAERVGIRKASVYHHFESKEALAVAMLERAREGVRAWVQSKSALNGMQRLDAYCFDLYLERLGAGEVLCPAGAFAGGWGHLPETVRAAARATMRVQVAFLSDSMALGRDDGSVAVPAKMTDWAAAEWFASAVQGALVSSRARLEPDESGAAVFSRLCRNTLDVMTP